MRAVFAGVLLLACACRQLVSFDEPKMQKLDPCRNGAPDEIQRTFGCPRPYLTGADCESCIEDQCSSQRQACEDDDTCTGFISDARVLDGPLVASEELSGRYADFLWGAEHKEPWAAPFDALNRCIQNECVAACNIGRDFSCVGTFDYSGRVSDSQQVRLHVLNFAGDKGNAGAHVSACAPYVPCDAKLATTETDDLGFASIEIDFSQSFDLLRMPQFSGFLRIESREPMYLPLEQSSSKPIADRELFRPPVFSENTVRTLASFQGGPWDESRGALAIMLFDCNYTRGRDLVVEHWAYNGDKLERVDPGASGLIYVNADGIPDPSLHTIDGAGWSGAWIYGLGTVWVVIRDAASRAMLAAFKEPSYLQPRTTHSTYGFPASREQLEKLSSVLR